MFEKKEWKEKRNKGEKHKRKKKREKKQRNKKKSDKWNWAKRKKPSKVMIERIERKKKYKWKSG